MYLLQGVAANAVLESKINVFLNLVIINKLTKQSIDTLISYKSIWILGLIFC